MEKELQRLKQQALSEIATTKSAADLQSLKIKYFGRKEGQLTKILRSIANLPLEQKKKIGSLANQIKQELGAAFNRKMQELKSKKTGEFFDVTLPGKRPEEGHLHPVSQVRIELEEIFKSMGFEICEGDELVSDYYNFESLNIPKDHPARDIQDTFFIKAMNHGLRTKNQEFVMRTHTSAMQVKIMESKKPPLKVVVPGRCFRNEATDASHEHTFYQMEGFVVDENISIANLIYTQKVLLSSIFKRDVKVRLRPGYFPFVEPGFELDCSCVICGGKGCSVCKHTGWVELIPCGMIHPKVFEFAGYSRGKYTGFAFGLGLTRLVMMKYGIDDIRLFMSGDLRFLEQF
ncbi:MAG: phenylalanine--tRNA ligase subunit alpha [Patescibacteria group bacterium]